MNKLLCATAVALALMGGAQAAEDRTKAIEALGRAGVPRSVVEAHAAWDDCKEAAVERFANQPEDARKVAEAAIAFCVIPETKYLLVLMGPHMTPDDANRLREHAMPALLARVTKMRAARAKTQQQNPTRSSATH